MAVVMETEDVEAHVARVEADVAHIRADLAEMKTDIRELRHRVTEVGDITASMRDELHVSLGGLREEMIKGDVALREEMVKGHLSLQQVDANLQRAIDDLRQKMTVSSLTDRIWMLFLTGTILAVMARGFKWL